MNKIRLCVAVFLVVCPILTQANNQTVVPTAVQVYDHEGKTTIEPVAMKKKEVLKISMPTPVECTTLKPVSGGTSMGGDRGQSVLYTRALIAEQSLNRNLEMLSFAPNLPESATNEAKSVVKDVGHTLVGTVNAGATQAEGEALFKNFRDALACLDAYKEEYRAGHEATSVEFPLAELHRIYNDIAYATALAGGDLSSPALIPRTESEALYYADLLKTEDVRITSLIISSTSNRIMYVSSAKLFGAITLSFPFTVTDDGSEVIISIPWWASFARSPVKAVEASLTALTPSSGVTVSIFASRASHIIETLRGVR